MRYAVVDMAYVRSRTLGRRVDFVKFTENDLLEIAAGKRDK